MTENEIKFMNHIMTSENPVDEFKKIVRYINDYRSSQQKLAK